MNVGKAVHYILSNNAAVTAVASTRIWTTKVPELNTTWPVIMIQRVSNPPLSSKDGNSTFFTRIQINVYATTQKATDALAVLVIAAMDRQFTSTTVNGFRIVQIDLIDENDLSEPFAQFDGLFHIAQDYQIVYNG